MPIFKTAILHRKRKQNVKVEKCLKFSLKNGGDGGLVTQLSNSWDPWTVACTSPLFMGFPSQEYWSGLPFPSPGNLPSPGMESWSPALQVDSLLTKPPGKTI